MLAQLNCWFRLSFLMHLFCWYVASVYWILLFFQSRHPQNSLNWDSIFVSTHKVDHTWQFGAKVTFCMSFKSESGLETLTGSLRNMPIRQLLNFLFHSLLLLCFSSSDITACQCRNYCLASHYNKCIYKTQRMVVLSRKPLSTTEEMSEYPVQL